MFGGAPLRNAQVNSGGIARHATRAALKSIVRSGASIVNVSPLRNDVLDEIGAEWLGHHAQYRCRADARPSPTC